jgi:phenylpropionate dioxygenase-like ring-hydroxylating dioxygenase large terminal subunit
MSVDAYSRPDPSFHSDLTRVGRGTPMGELLRRYWHPVGLTSDAGEMPKMVRALGEDLVLFRDRGGRAGLLYPRCAHRGASLYYGRTEERGIRCCYHGWLFDVEGRCLEQPFVTNRGSASVVRQPAYPVQERYGLIFAYLGPPAKQPLLPRYNLLEQLAAGEHIEADDTSIGSGGPALVPCTWLQHFENVMDPYHVAVLHSSFSGVQFTEQMRLVPQVRFENAPYGVRSIQLRDLGGGRVHHRVTETVLPTIRAVATPRAEHAGPCSQLGWVLPLDDTSFRIYSAGRVRSPGELGKGRSRFNGKTWFELTPEEHQRMPGDYEAQVSQGAITFHSEEHLVSTDRGIAMLRAMLKRQVETVAQGGDPVGVMFEGASDLVELAAGTEVRESVAVDQQ